MRYSGMTDKGMVRTTNQDSFAAGEINGVVWAVVCDGMGGVSGGNIASSLATERIQSAIENADARSLCPKNAQKLFSSALAAANIVVYEKAVSDQSLFGMGTTAVAALVSDSQAVIAHIGDSRAYLITEDSITQITKDHSLVQAMVERGEITESQAKTHKHKHMITRAVGVAVDVEPEFNELSVGEGFILLCSDGLTNCVDDGLIKEIVLKEGLNAPKQLIDQANAAGGSDNITALVIKC